MCFSIHLHVSKDFSNSKNIIIKIIFVSLSFFRIVTRFICLSNYIMKVVLVERMIKTYIYNVCNPKDSKQTKNTMLEYYKHFAIYSNHWWLRKNYISSLISILFRTSGTWTDCSECILFSLVKLKGIKFPEYKLFMIQLEVCKRKKEKNNALQK